jgi:hypothetical protein
MGFQWRDAGNALAITAATLLAATACSSAPTPSSPSSRVPPAFNGYDIATLDTFFGGAWVHTTSVKADCGATGSQTCAHLLVASDPACTDGFYANVEFRDEHGDIVDTVRGRALGVNPDTATPLNVPTPSIRSVRHVTIESVACD